MIELVRAGRTPEELAKEFEPSAQAIRNWVAQADRDEGRREDGLTTAERDELSRLRRENRQLKLEREILSKAAAWFAREILSRLDNQCSRFIAKSPFVVIASTGEYGQVDLSPKGDPPGFVKVLDPTILAIPDRRGIRRVDRPTTSW